MSEMSTPVTVHQPGSGEDATSEEYARLLAHGLWEGEDAAGFTQWAVLDAYRAGRADATR